MALSCPRWADVTQAAADNNPGLFQIATESLFANIQSDLRWLPFLESIGKSPEQLAASSIGTRRQYEQGGYIVGEATP